MNSRDDWYSANKARIFPDFGSLQSAEMSIDGLAPRTGEAYTDMRLTSVQSGNRSPRDGSDYIVVLTYETLGAAFVQIKDDNIDLELNGLRRVTRASIAKAGTDIPSDDKDIGTDYIDHQIDAEATVRCFLASYEIDDTDSYREFERTYIQAGTLSVQKSNINSGIVQVTTTFLVTEGSTVGPIIRRSTDDFSGLNTISVTTLQNKSGQSITQGGSTTPVNSYESLTKFSYPGVLNLVNKVLFSNNRADFDDLSAIDFYLTPPNESMIAAETHIFFQTGSDIIAGDYTYDGASKLWNPQSWASNYASGLDRNRNPFSLTQAFRGYRAFADLDIVLREASAMEQQLDDLGVTFGQFMVNGRQISTSNSANVGIQGGPEDPEGNKYVLDVQITPAFETVDGSVGYKKKIVVATIPARTGISYVPPGATQVVALDTASSANGRASNGAYAGITANTLTLEWDRAQSITNVTDLKYAVLVLVRSYSGANTEWTYRVCTNYSPSTAVLTLQGDLTSARLTNADGFYHLQPFTRTGKVAGDGQGANNKITLPVSLTGSNWNGYNDVFNGLEITITAGAGSGQTKTITDYDNTTHVATVDTAFSSAIGPNSVFRIGPASL
tara:strand:- start:1049 stop:2887 length:1839 start_codon:yes stop_codon:yes gene_type:complete